MSQFSGTDFYEIDSLLTEDEITIRDTVRAWVEEKFLPLIEDAYDNAYFPTEVIPQVAEIPAL